MALSLAAISSALCDLASVPWLEETLIIGFIAVAFILTHQVGVASVKRPAKDVKLAWAAKDEDEEEEEDEGRSYSRGRAQTRPALPAAQRLYKASTLRAPETSAEMPGITDRRFVGRIICYKEAEGYGFISCPPIYHRFIRDIFLHKNQTGSFRVDDVVSFSVFLNKNGYPQAKDLEESKAPPPRPTPDLLTWGCWNPPAEPFEEVEPVIVRQPLNPRAKPFQTQAGAVPETVAADLSWTPEPEATHKQQPSWQKEWDEWKDSKQYWQQPSWQKERNEWQDGKQYWQQPSWRKEWNEWADSEQCGQSDQDAKLQGDRDAKGGEKRWVPKAKPSFPAAGSNGKKLWVPK